MNSTFRFPITAMCVCLALADVHGISQDHAAPFGLRMGMPREAVLSRVSGYRESQPGFLQVRDVPEKDPRFEGYGLVVSPSRGLCKIMAVGKDIPLNPSGDGLKALFAQLMLTLDGQYGEHELFDFLKPGSPLPGSEHWAEALAKHDRVLSGTWTPSPDTGLASVLLESIASGPTVGYLELHFEGPDFTECRDELARSQRISAPDVPSLDMPRTVLGRSLRFHIGSRQIL